MNYTPYLRQGARNALATVLYIAVVGWTMSHSEDVMGNVPEVVAAVFMLTLFVVSALVTASLVLWQPLNLLVDGKKQEAGALLGATGATLVVALLAAGVLLIVSSQ